MANATAVKKQQKLGGIKRSVHLHELQDVVDLCFARMSHMCYREISNMTGLSAHTVWRYKMRAVSLSMRCGTLRALAAAAGLRLAFHRTSVRLYTVAD